MLQLNLDFFRIRFFLEELKKPFEFDSGLQSFYRDHTVDSSGQKIEKKRFLIFLHFSTNFLRSSLYDEESILQSWTKIGTRITHITPSNTFNVES